jgi:hypothetical protein
MNAKIERRGGARLNSGPKPKLFSVRQLKKAIREVDRRAKTEGKTLIGGVLDIFYDDRTVPAVKLQAAKLILDRTMIQVSEGGDADKSIGPTVYLPAQRPVLTALDGGKTV